MSLHQLSHSHTENGVLDETARFQKTNSAASHISVALGRLRSRESSARGWLVGAGRKVGHTNVNCSRNELSVVQQDMVSSVELAEGGGG